jgi:hypothetical protein
MMEVIQKEVAPLQPFLLLAYARFLAPLFCVFSSHPGSDLLLLSIFPDEVHAIFINFSIQIKMA